MRLVFTIIFFINLPSVCSGTICEGINKDLALLAKSYSESVKTFSNTLMTTANVSIATKPDVKNAESIRDKVSALVSSCKKGDANENELPDAISEILELSKKQDLDFQKMGIFENVALNSARINSVIESNKLIGALLRLEANGDDPGEDEEEDGNDDSAGDDLEEGTSGDDDTGDESGDDNEEEEGEEPDPETDDSEE